VLWRQPPLAIHLLVVLLLGAVLLLLWRLGQPPLRITESIWMLGREGTIRVIVWLVCVAACASATAAWIGGKPLRARLLITWLIAALVAAIAFPTSIAAIVRAL
jgi:hypothetical protein